MVASVQFGTRVEFKDDGLKLIRRKINELNKLDISVGFLDEEVAQIAVWQEFGTPDARHPIPQRSFIRSTMFEQRDKISAVWAKQTRRMIRAKKYKPLQAAEVVAIQITKMIENKIRRSRSWAVPNAQATIDAKGGDWPLHDTNTMAESVRWTIKKNGVLLAQGGSNG